MIQYTLKGIDLIVYHQDSFYWFGLSFWLAMMFVFIDALTHVDQNFEARMQKTNLRQMINIFKKAKEQETASGKNNPNKKMIMVFLFFLALIFAFSSFGSKKTRK